MINTNSPIMDKARDVKKDFSDMGALAVEAAKSQKDVAIMSTNSMMEKARDVKSDLSDLGSLAVDAAHAKAAQLREGAMDVYEQGCVKAKGAQTTAENYIKNEPIKAVLVAGAVGLALGYLLTRCTSK